MAEDRKDENEEAWVPNPEFLALWRERFRGIIRQLRDNRLKTRIDTSDTLQEFTLQVWKNLPSFRGKTEQEFEAWIKAIATGHAANANRRHHAQKRDIKAEISGLTEFLANADQADQSVQAGQRELQIRTAEAIEQLDARYQFVVLQYTFEQRSFAEIAEELTCSPGTVRNVYNKAIDQLRLLLSGSD